MFVKVLNYIYIYMY